MPDYRCPLSGWIVRRDHAPAPHWIELERKMSYNLIHCNCGRTYAEADGHNCNNVSDAYRIEELEAKLAKAVEALSFYADPTYNGYDVCLVDYGLSMTTGCIIQDDGDLARTTLAELKGENDE